MIICKKCQTANSDKRKFCISCGESLVKKPIYGSQENEKKTNSTVSWFAIVFAFVLPLVGLCLGIIAYKADDDCKKTLPLVAIIISIIIMVGMFLLFVRPSDFHVLPRFI